MAEQPVPENAVKEQLSPTNPWVSFFELIKTVSFVFVVAFLIRTYLVQPFVVDGASMEPNFHHQEYILVDKLGYRLRQPARGDVVVFHPPGRQDNFIKRIIGLPGETVTVTGHQVTVNGQVVSELYLPDRGQLGGPPLSFEIDQNEYFVLGDNRDFSKDSRELGPIAASRIIGRAWLVLFPITDLAVVTTPNYPDFAASASPQTVLNLRTRFHF